MRSARPTPIPAWGPPRSLSPLKVTRSTPDSRCLTQLLLILLVGLYVLNLGYGFDGSFTRLKDFAFISSTLTGKEETATPGNRFADTPIAEVPIPVPKQYLLGMDVQKRDFEDYGQLSYLRGVWKDGGWWYYYVYGLAVKTPHGSQFLLLFSIFTLLYRWRVRKLQDDGQRPVGTTWRDLVILLTPAITVLVLVSSQLEFNHHVRYVLPVLGFTYSLAGVTAFWFPSPCDSPKPTE